MKISNAVAWLVTACLSVLGSCLYHPALHGLILSYRFRNKEDVIRYAVYWIIWVILFVVGGWSSLKAFKQGNHVVRIVAVTTGIVSILSCLFYLMETIGMAVDRY